MTVDSIYKVDANPNALCIRLVYILLEITLNSIDLNKLKNFRFAVFFFFLKFSVVCERYTKRPISM